MAKKERILEPYLLTATSGILLVLSFPPFKAHFLAWIALVPFLYSLVGSPFEKKRRGRLAFRQASLLGLLLGTVFCYGTLYWLYNIFGITGLLLIAVLCLFFFLYASILKFILSRWENRYALPIAAPVLWVAIEYIRSEGWWLKFAWMSLGYSQHNFLPALQFASMFGQYGISFLIVFVNSAIVFLIINRSDKKRVVRVASALLLSTAAILSFGIISSSEKYNPTIRVKLVQDEDSDFSVYARLTEQSPDHADFVLWPEYALPEFVEQEPELKSRIADLALLSDSYVILGAKDRAERYSSRLGATVIRKQGASESEIDSVFKFYNTAYLFSPEGEIIGKYYKTNPIQFFSDGVAGTEFPSFETDFGRIGILICYDADYSYVARRITRNGAEMLFIPTYDSMNWSELQHKQHSAMTSMRAVENGRFIARATTSGVSQIIEPTGKITQTIDIGKSDAAIGLIEPIHGLTFYTRFGFVFPYLCIVLSLALCLFGWQKGRFPDK